MAAQPLENLIASIGNAFKTALYATDQHSLSTFMDSFETAPAAAGKAATVRPKTITLPVPQSDGSYAPREVPVAALLHHNSLQLDELKVKLRITLSRDEGNSLQAEVGPNLSPQALEGAEPNLAEIELSFKRGDPPEGVARVAQHFHQTL